MAARFPLSSIRSAPSSGVRTIASMSTRRASVACVRDSERSRACAMHGGLELLRPLFVELGWSEAKRGSVVQVGCVCWGPDRGTRAAAPGR
jgi:hypothetical protein